MSIPHLPDEVVDRAADRASVSAAAYVAADVVVSARVEVGPHACILGGRNADGQLSTLGVGASIGANATLLAGVSIGHNARVAPGAVVTRSVPPFAVVAGNPATISGYIDAVGRELPAVGSQAPSQVGQRATRVAGVSIHRLRVVADLRGNLSVGEFGSEIPFVPMRYFMVFGVPTAETRGEHAHRQCAQFLIAVRGSVSVLADDGCNREEFLLDDLGLGIYLPPMTWGIQYKYSPDAILLVFASHHYDAEDYIRDYDQFMQLAGSRA